MRQVRKSSFRELVEYLADPQNKQERVGQVTVTNCHQDHALDAAFEVLATQALNTKAENDKTYHLLISFPPGETPAADVLRDIEARLVASIGYEEHQRVSAVHHDTDHLHIHVAINKIHPERHTIHEPYRDYHTLGKMSEKLEIEYGLQRVNHVARKSLSESRAADMEYHAGVESLLGWIKRECADQIKGAQSWAELHEVMRSNGLELRERANGLVVTDGAGIGVKASSIARDLSKAKLEARFGPFHRTGEPGANRATVAARKKQAPPVEKVGQRPPPRSKGRAPALADAGEVKIHTGRPSAVTVEARRAQAVPVERVGTRPPPRSKGRTPDLSALGEMRIAGGRRYQQQPIYQQKINTVELHARYKAEQSRLGPAIQDALAQARGKKERAIEAAKRSNALKRSAIKLMKGPGVNKKLLYALASRSLRADMEKIHAEHQRDRNAVYAAHRRYAWADWLQVKAKQGDQEALAALRAREARQRRSNSILGGARVRRTGPVPGLKPDNITKAGTIIYRVGATAIRDDGATLNIARGATEPGLEAALQMAMYRYGSSITVNGTDEFKERIARVAAASKLAVTFDDPALEARRQQIAAEAAARTKLRDAEKPAQAVEFTDAQARAAGAFHEDALSERDAAASRPLSTPTKEKQHHDDREQRPGQRDPRSLDGRPDRRRTGAVATNGAGSGGRPARTGRSDAGRLRGGRVRGVGGLVGGHVKPGLGRVGTEPPPQSTHHLRALHELGVVHIGNRSEVLLPRDVPDRVEQHGQGAERNHEVRREVHRAGGVTPTVVAPADKYIAERESKRIKGFDIPKHRRYNEADAGAVKFAGLRQVEGDTLALLRRDDDVIVMAVDATTARRMKRLSLGDDVSLTAQGTVKTKGRSR
nr:TraI/MobA(P) family conjugative relaxase [Burkholderia cenocepacia]